MTEGSNARMVPPQHIGYPLPIYDLFLDLPHPTASARCEHARIIGATDNVREASEKKKGFSDTTQKRRGGAMDMASRALQEELYQAETIAKITKYAFPDHNDQLYTASLSVRNAINGNNIQEQTHSISRRASSSSQMSVGSGGTNPSRGEGQVIEPENHQSGANLNRHDVYLNNFTSYHHHSFLLRLSCGVRIHGHVRRYLPSHLDAPIRSDVGRRGVRAFVILTRAPGGERFWGAVLRTMEGISMSVSKPSVVLLQAFLLRLQEKHSALYGLYEEKCHERALQRSRWSSHDPTGAGGDGKEQQATSSMSFTAVQVAGIEMGFKEDDPTHRIPRVPLDVVTFRLPPSLQPGYIPTAVEDLDSPLLPLLRCLHASHYMRLLAALLCERRIIFISDNLSRLSACVRGAAAMLAQGLLVWQHVYIPVLPPHLLKYLATPMPYLIGLLEPYARNLDVIPGMGDVLCVNLDNNTIWTFNVKDPSLSFPDFLEASQGQVPKTAPGVDSPSGPMGGGGLGSIDEKGGSPESSFAAEGLAWDLKAALKRDQKMWTQTSSQLSQVIDGSIPGNSNEDDDTATSNGEVTVASGISSGIKPISMSSRSAKENNPTSASSSPRLGFGVIKSVRNLKASRMVTTTASKRWGTRSTKKAASHSIHSSMPLNSSDEEEENDDMFKSEPAPGEISETNTKKSVPCKKTYSAVETGRWFPWDACENESGEEAMRIALVSFFLYLYGDMGMYLTESQNGTLFLDRKKFLILKKMAGDAEHTAIFRVLANLTRSAMFKQFVKARIDDLEHDDEGLLFESAVSNLTPLFSKCEKFLLINRTEPRELPGVVKNISSACPQWEQVLASESIRERALGVSSKRQVFDENAVMEIVTLANESRDVLITLSCVMGVIWGRMSKIKNWRYPLFALHMLRSLLLHGPITVVSEASEGGNLVRSLTHFKAKNGEGAKEVRQMAEMVYQLLCDKPRLFAQRRYVAGRRLCKTGSNKQANTIFAWSNYLVRQLPMSAKLADVHVILEPKMISSSQGCVSPELHDTKRGDSNSADNDEPLPMDDDGSLGVGERIQGMAEAEQNAQMLNSIGEETSQDFRLIASLNNSEKAPQHEALSEADEEDPLFEDHASFLSSEDDSGNDDEYSDDDNSESVSGGSSGIKSDDAKESAS